jgi:anthranilate synthase/aminodeoxychorismate synthase-like glutamine amidotransferase
MKIALLDNYDSFAYSLVHLVGMLIGELPLVFRNDAITLSELRALNLDALVVSPGPGHPADGKHFGVSRAAIETLSADVPMLGVCLGHQGIALAFGGHVVRAPAPMHGKTSVIAHDNSALYTDLPTTITVMRYHSLMADATTLPACLSPTAWTEDGILMSVQHKQRPLFGVQFHPESVATPDGSKIMDNFLQYARAHRAGA